MTVFWLCLLASMAALVGGFVAIRNRDKLDQALGLTAGLILGLVAFGLIPEISRLSTRFNIHWAMAAFVVGFLIFHILEKTILIHASHESEYGQHVHPKVGLAGAIGLIGHSFLDGATIGVAFQAGSAVLVPVSLAVIGHRFVDGFNTANLMVFHKNKPALARRVLYVASVMPVLGGLSTVRFVLSDSVLAIYLGFFAGFLLYIGASDILPQAHSKKSSGWTITLTILGAIFMFIITRFS